jgi:hypothetical protein
MCYNVSVKSSKEILQSKFEAEYEAAEDMQPYFSGIRLLASEITC